MMVSVLVALQAMLLLNIVQHDKTTLTIRLSKNHARLLQLASIILLFVALLMWIQRDATSMGIAHAIMLFGLVSLVPVFLLSFRANVLRWLAAIIPLLLMALQLINHS